jgi:hypothetical protein
MPCTRSRLAWEFCGRARVSLGKEERLLIGSAAILAVLPNPPDGELTATHDADVIPPQD